MAFGLFTCRFYRIKSPLLGPNSWLTIQDVIGHYKDYNEKIDLLGDTADVASVNDKWSSRFLEYFQLIINRKEDLKDLYPFEIEENSNYIKLKQKLETPHLIYLALLVSSNLENFPKLESTLTKDFEKISRFAIEGYFKECNIIELGGNSNFRGNTIAKIRKISKYASQEKGLDILVYRPFEDKIANMIMILIQCACGKDWDSKTNETKSYESFLNFYKFKPMHSMFIPYYISSDNGFKESHYLVDRLVFERKRILEFLENNYDFFRYCLINCVSFKKRGGFFKKSPSLFKLNLNF